MHTATDSAPRSHPSRANPQPHTAASTPEDALGAGCSWCLTSSKKLQLVGTYLMEEVGDCQVIVIEKNLLLCSEEPFSDGQARSRHGRGVVLHVEFVGEFIGRQFAHWKKHETWR